MDKFRTQAGAVLANDIFWLPRAVAADHQWFTNHIAARVVR